MPPHSFRTLSLAVSLILTGLSAGLLFAYFVSATPGLSRLGDRAYLSAMQSINKAILNPTFIAVYFGAAVVLIVTTVLFYRAGLTPEFRWLLAASIVYVVGVVGVTVAGNVPLNDALDSVNMASLDDLATEASLVWPSPSTKSDSRQTYSM